MRQLVKFNDYQRQCNTGLIHQEIIVHKSALIVIHILDLNALFLTTTTITIGGRYTSHVSFLKINESLLLNYVTSYDALMVSYVCSVHTLLT